MVTLPVTRYPQDWTEQVQKTFLRFAFRRANVPYSSYSDRLYKSNLKSLEYRRVVFDQIFMYKIINNISGLKFSDYFTVRNLKYNLRGRSILIEPLMRYMSPVWCGSFFHRAPKVWNLLPVEISNSSSLCLFKNRLAKFDLRLITEFVYSWLF